MTTSSLSSIVIVGGDLTGWTVAAALANSLRELPCQITVLELPDVINVEPAQFTAPSTLDFFRYIGIDEDELIRKTGATLRLGTGIHYRNDAKDHRILAFGQHGSAAGVVPFHHYVSRKRLSSAAANINAYSPNAIASRSGRVIRPTDADASKRPPLDYGLNLNTEKLTQLLISNAKLAGVRSMKGRIDSVTVEPNSGYISGLALDGGAHLEGDLYIDCSGETALLIGAAVGVGFEDWHCYLPCTRMMAVTTPSDSDNTPVHHIGAMESAWVSTTPLQHRAAHRLLYAHEHLDDNAAEAALRSHVSGLDVEAIATSDIRSGRRREFWARNCVAFGAAAATVEPLDLSTLHMTQSAAMELVRLLPATPASPELAIEFNRRVKGRFDSLRDFTRLHYAASSWRDTPFWRNADAAGHPASLQQKIDLFTDRGHLELEDNPVFPRDTWVSALLSAGIWPEGYHGLLDLMDAAALDAHFGNLRQAIVAGMDGMWPHREYLAALRR